MSETNEAYNALYQSIKDQGRTVLSRFGNTRELLNASFTCPLGAILSRTGQNPRIGFAEGIQAIAGLYDGDCFKKYAPSATQSLFTSEMNYGVRLIGQYQYAVDELLRNPDNREVYLFIGRLGESGTPSLPCTLGVQLLIRDNKLYLNDFMRSLDILKGLPVDVIIFGMVGQMLASCLGVEPGDLTVTAGSAHYYIADEEAGKLPIVPGRKRRFILPNCYTLKSYHHWAIEESYWNWNDYPEGIYLKEERNATIS